MLIQNSKPTKEIGAKSNRSSIPIESMLKGQDHLLLNPINSSIELLNSLKDRDSQTQTRILSGQVLIKFMTMRTRNLNDHKSLKDSRKTREAGGKGEIISTISLIPSFKTNNLYGQLQIISRKEARAVLFKRRLKK